MAIVFLEVLYCHNYDLKITYSSKLCTPTFMGWLVFVRNWLPLRAGTPRQPEKKYALHNIFHYSGFFLGIPTHVYSQSSSVLQHFYQVLTNIAYNSKQRNMYKSAHKNIQYLHSLNIPQCPLINGLQRAKGPAIFRTGTGHYHRLLGDTDHEVNGL